MTGHLRVATPGDARSLAEVHVRTWRAAYRGQVPDARLDALSIDARTEVWRRILFESSWPVPTTLVGEHDARLVGFASVQACRDDDAAPETGELSAIYLLSEHRGRGWGRALLEEAVTTLRSARLSAATLWVGVGPLRRTASVR